MRTDYYRAAGHGVRCGVGCCISECDYFHEPRLLGRFTVPRAVGTQAGYLQVYPGSWPVTRSRCAPFRYQRVTIVYRLWGFNMLTKKWGFDFQIVGTKVLPPRTRGQINFNYYNPHFRRTSIDAVITWRTGTGVFLGRTRADFNRVADYQCVGGPGVCQALRARPSAHTSISRRFRLPGGFDAAGTADTSASPVAVSSVGGDD